MPLLMPKIIFDSWFLLIYNKKNGNSEVYMADNWLQRQNALIGEEGTDKLKNSRVMIFGIGGVGSFVTEALCRAGVGSLVLVDGDSVSESNINRQLIADTETIGRPKAEVGAERVKKINPDCDVKYEAVFADESNTASLLEKYSPDFIVDAIDCVSTKILIAKWADEHSAPIISSMGTGNKLDVSKFKIDDIKKTSVCPLARVMRRELKNRGISKLTVLYSTEEPVRTGRRVPASISYVPSSAGLMIAGYVIGEIIKN